jgi:hypothetical protein
VGAFLLIFLRARLDSLAQPGEKFEPAKTRFLQLVSFNSNINLAFAAFATEHPPRTLLFEPT